MTNREPWIKMHVDYYEGPKFDRLSPAAEVLWIRSIAYSGGHKTDGFVATRWVHALANTNAGDKVDDLVVELIAAGLWEEADRGYVIHDYLEHQTSAEHMDEVATRRAAAGRASGAARSRKPRQHPVEQPVEQSVQQSVEQKEELTTNPPFGPPTGGDGLVPAGQMPQAGPRSRGTRLPPGFALTANMRQWARDNAPAVDCDRELETFRDYWIAQPGAKGVKTDWPATWRNWMRRAAERAPGGTTPARARPETVEDRQRAQAQAEYFARRERWLTEHAVTLEEFEAHRHDPAWMEAVTARRQARV